MRAVYAEAEQLVTVDRRGPEPRDSIRCTDGLVDTWSGRAAEAAPERVPRAREPETGRVMLEKLVLELGEPSDIEVDERSAPGSDEAAFALDRLLAMRIRFGLHGPRRRARRSPGRASPEVGDQAARRAGGRPRCETARPVP